jgi:lipopolysaccharide transport system permease protein
LRELGRYRELLTILVRRDLKVRYKNSVLGFGWSLLNPLVQVAIITIVIKFLMKIEDIPNYHAYVFCATLPWLYFSVGTMDTATSLLMYRELIRKTSFPRELIPLAYVLANMVHFTLATAVFLLYMAAGSVFFLIASGNWDFAIQPTVVFLPLPMLGMLLLVAGISFFVSVWTLYYTDVVFLSDSLLKVLQWLVPVLYGSEVLRERNPWGQGQLFYSLYMLNPLATFITTFRKLALAPARLPGMTRPTTPMGLEDWAYLAIGLVVSACFARAGYAFFNRRKWKLAERA